MLIANSNLYCLRIHTLTLSLSLSLFPTHTLCMTTSLAMWVALLNNRTAGDKQLDLTQFESNKFCYCHLKVYLFHQWRKKLIDGKILVIQYIQPVSYPLYQLGLNNLLPAKTKYPLQYLSNERLGSICLVKFRWWLLLFLNIFWLGSGFNACAEGERPGT